MIEVLFLMIPSQFLVFLLQCVNHLMTLFDLSSESLLQSVFVSHALVFFLDLVVRFFQVVDLAVCIFELFLDQMVIEVLDKFVHIGSIVYINLVSTFDELVESFDLVFSILDLELQLLDGICSFILSFGTGRHLLRFDIFD